jgi:hypothetical protein
MGALKSLAILTAGAAIGGVALLAYRISQETGKPMQAALADVPSEMQRLFGELKAKGNEALEKGRAAYVDKHQELADQFREFTAAR